MLRIDVLFLLLATPSLASKRGLLFIPDPAHPQDDLLWTRPGSDLSWYYNYLDASSAPLLPATGSDHRPVAAGISW